MEDEVLKTVLEGLKYEPLKDILIKPLEPIKFNKEVTEMVPTDEKDEDGFIKYETKTETKEVESEWREGIVLAIPTNMKDIEFKAGDTVVYHGKFSKEFDLFKTSVLVKPYDIVAIKK